MTALETIPEDEVTISNLQSLFDRAFFNTYIDGDGDLVVKDGEHNIFLSVMENTKLLAYFSYFRIREATPLHQKLNLVNKINDSVVMVRFSIQERNPDTLMVDYYLPFEGGVSASQIISTLRVYERIINVVMHIYDEDDIIE